MERPCQAKVSINALNVPQTVHKHHLEPFENDLERFGKHPKGLLSVWALFPTQNALWGRDFVHFWGPWGSHGTAMSGKSEHKRVKCAPDSAQTSFGTI